ncbi:hypothetical protein ABZ793_24030 [Micromonospora sp. NPDC047465]|uniref:hypothetical protein n=1 Tax=Micromonospora sp. NPDC047465 TaxID=3154813 RepID=UPI0033EF6D8A
MTGDVAGQDITGAEGFRGRRSWWRVLRIVLVVVWVAWAALSWWSAPREASRAQARSDLSAGRMVSYQWADGWDSTGRWGWTDGRTLRCTGCFGPLFVWRTGNWRVHYTEFDRGSVGSVSPGFFDAMQHSGPLAAAFDQALQSANLQPRWQGVDAPLPVRALPVVLLLSILTVLVFGPDPARGTRWFWFWLLTGVPLGLGLIWWLARERPWYPTDPPPPDPSGRDPRDRWYVGVLIGIATSITVSVLLYGLRRVLGDWYVPHDAGN